MGIFNSIKNQIGRDIGKSISNVILKDAHATPIRMTGNKSSTRRKNISVDEYEKKIKLIDLSQTQTTIIRKLGAVLVEFESDIKNYLADGFIDLKEEIELAKRFYKILDVFAKIEKQFTINGEDTTRLIEIYQQYFKEPMLMCIDKLKEQESDNDLTSKYQQLYTEIKSIAE